ncbi:MAG: LytTR family DNA-binding domain-containing protein [Ruminococcus sp.]|jgi:DNA-binding LytR/AlgR family response regulator|nr:LytTR family DNA-binding domain-containing protein [Ruminococcus sp.]
MLRIAICDDEEVDLCHNEAAVKKDLSRRGIPYSEICSCTSPEKLLEGSFDLYFLDIEMPCSNGLETAKKLREKGIGAPIVYVTNYTAFALAAYEVFPLSLVSKPLTDKTVKNVMDEFFRRFKDESERRIAFKTTEGLTMLTPSEIIYLHCVARNDIIAVTKSKMYTLREKFEDLYEKTSPHGFFKIRRDIIVNLSHVKAVTDDCSVKMTGGALLPVAFRVKNDFLAAVAGNAIASFSGR